MGGFGMAWAQSDLDAIKKAIASGELRVEYQDKVVQYRRINDLITAMGVIQGELASQSGLPPRALQVLFVTSNGWRR